MNGFAGKQSQIDTLFIQAVDALAKQHNCRIDWATSDFAGRQLNIVGGTDEEQQAVDLAIVERFEGQLT